MRNGASCLICQSLAIHQLFRSLPYQNNVVKCNDCGFVFYWPRPTDDEISDYYDSDYYEENYGIDEPRHTNSTSDDRSFQRRLDQMRNRVSGNRLLDVGCGLGRFLKAAQTAGWQAYGIDVSPAATEYACRSGLNISLGTMQTATFAPQSFDVITLWDSLEHLTDPMSDLRAAAQSLREGGFIFIQTQSVSSISFAVTRERWPQFTPPHICHFSPRSMRFCLQRAGFHDIEIVKTEVFHRMLNEADSAAGAQAAKKWNAARMLNAVKWRLTENIPRALRFKYLQYRYRNLLDDDFASIYEVMCVVARRGGVVRQEWSDSSRFGLPKKPDSSVEAGNYA